MKYVITLSCFSFLLLTINAQVISKADSASSNYDDRTYTKIANEATFVGGERAWNQFLSNHLMYSNKSKKKYHPQTVVVYFLVEKNGLVRDAKISSRHTEFDDAVLNLMSQSPPWNPATMDGKPVKSIKELQINFNFLGEPIIPIDLLSILDSLKDPHLSDSVYKIVDEPASYSGGQ
jgi:Gram-negative bacterial TonB protein C-terminal